MRPAPQKPGESTADFRARVKASEERWMSGRGRPKTGGGASSGGGPVKPVPATPSGGRGRGGMTPPPGMMYGPNDALIPIPKKRGNTPVSSSGGKKDAVRIFSSSSSRSAGARGPKMVSRFKDGGCVMAGRGGKYKGEM